MRGQRTRTSILYDARWDVDSTDCFALRWEATPAAAAIAAAESQKYLLNLAFTTHTKQKRLPKC